ncbi:unnamed protein product [Linum trigynum]|uniref:Uncharacterized protein n=1 Tax=Linum trigynum TaxID=586398 RepID=A0AAV2FWK6_9ROSI
MLELVESTRDSESPISEDDTFHNILGYKSGYCNGLGHGQSSPKKRTCQEQNFAELMREKNILQERCANLEEKVIEMNERQVLADQKQALTDEKLDTTQQQLARLDKLVEYLKEGNILPGINIW